MLRRAVFRTYLLTLVALASTLLVATMDVLAEGSNQNGPKKETKNKHLEIALWELELAESGYFINPDIKTFSRLLTAQERLVYKTCFPKLTKTLTPPERATDPECLGRVAETLALDSRNAAAICARDGLFSNSCISRYSAIVQRTLSSQYTSSQTKLDVYLSHAKNRQDLGKLYSELRRLSQSIATQKTGKATVESVIKLDEKISEYRKVADKLLGYECSVEEFHVGRERSVTPVTSSTSLGMNQSAQSDKQPLSIREQLEQKRIALGIDKDKKENETSTRPEQPIPSDQIVRVRSITKDCKELVRQIFEVIPNYAPAHCELSGLYSPQCIRGLQLLRRKEIMKKKMKAGGDTETTTTNSKGFETF
jgi:hypothetical protein